MLGEKTMRSFGVTSFRTKAEARARSPSGEGIDVCERWSASSKAATHTAKPSTTTAARDGGPDDGRAVPSGSFAGSEAVIEGAGGSHGGAPFATIFRASAGFRRPRGRPRWAGSGR